MAVEKVINISVNLNGGSEAIAQTSKLNSSLKNLDNTTGNLGQGMRGTGNAILETAGQSQFLDNVTGGLSSTISTVAGNSMIFSKGLNLLTGVQKIYTLVVGTTTGALKALRVALITTGLGAIVVLLGVFIAKMNESAEATEREKGATDALNASLSRMSNLYKDNLAGIEAVNKERVLRAKIAGKSEKDILAIEQETSAERNKLYKEEQNRILKQLENNKLTAEARKKLNDELLLNDKVYFKSLEDEKIKGLEKDLSIIEKQREANKKATKKNTADAIQDEKDRLKRLEEEEKKKYDFEQEWLEKQNKAELASLDAIDLAIKTNADRLLTEQELELENERILYEEKLANAVLFNQNTEAIEIEHLNNINNINLLAQEKDYEIKKTAAAKEIEIAKELAEAKNKLQNLQLDNVSAGIGVLKGVFEKNKAIQKGLLIAENAAGIAKIIINTMAGNAKTIGTMGVVPAAPFVLANNIGAGISIAASIAATTKGLAALGGGSAGGGGANLPSANRSSAPQFNVVGNSGVNQLAQTMSGQSEQAPIQAYVVASNVTSAQSMNRNIITNASLG